MNSSRLHRLAIVALLLSTPAFAASPPDAGNAKTTKAAKAPKAARTVSAEPVRAVYHLNQGIDQAADALRNIGNHLSADPAARIVVVSHAKGIDFLLPDAKDKDGNAFSQRIGDLALKGVDFRVCNFTLESRKIDPATVNPDARIVPSGVAEVARLQFKEHYSYVKP
jgi:hypothetical protein